MPDGSAAPQMAARDGAGKSLLFPVTPQPGETLLGYLTRCLAKNYLGVPVQFMKHVDVNLAIKGDLLGRLQAQLPAVQEALRLSDEELSRLWGTAAVGPDRSRLLGGVWLRSSLIEQATRRAPPSIAADEADQALWMVRHLTFCSTRWEELVDHCPSQWCGKPLTWPRAQALDRCRHCHTRLSEWKPRKVPVRDRRVLAWVTSLFSDCRTTRQSAVAKVPANFEIESETDVYELLLAFAKAASSLRLADGDDRNCSVRDMAAAARFMLEYPRSHWDALQKPKLGERPRLYGVLARIARDSPVPAVRRQLDKILAGGYQEVLFLRAGRQPPPGALTTTGAAAVLSVQAGDVKRLVTSGLLHPVRTSGRERQHNLFDDRVIQRIREELDARMSWRSFSSLTGLPTLAIEQLLALGHLCPLDDAVALSLFGQRQLERERAERLIDRLRDLPYPSQMDGWLPLEQVFRGVGGREKPWAPIIVDGLMGHMPGKLVRLPDRSRLAYGVSGVTARALILGGPGGGAWYNFPRKAYGEFDRDDLRPGEAAEYLNCSAVDLSWLVEKRCLLPVAASQPRLFRRWDVETLGVLWMTAREAAVRLDIAARHVWYVLERHNIKSLGRGFYLRDDLEAVIEAELGELRCVERDDPGDRGTP